MQPRLQSGGQRPQAALLLLSTVEPSCRVRDGSQEQCNVVVDLASRGIPVTEISLSLPSLDEVFFTLTGQKVGTAPAKELIA